MPDLQGAATTQRRAHCSRRRAVRVVAGQSHCARAVHRHGFRCAQVGDHAGERQRFAAAHGCGQIVIQTDGCLNRVGCASRHDCINAAAGVVQGQHLAAGDGKGVRIVHRDAAHRFAGIQCDRPERSAGAERGGVARTLRRQDAAPGPIAGHRPVAVSIHAPCANGDGSCDRQLDPAAAGAELVKVAGLRIGDVRIAAADRGPGAIQSGERSGILDQVVSAGRGPGRGAAFGVKIECPAIDRQSAGSGDDRLIICGAVELIVVGGPGTQRQQANRQRAHAAARRENAAAVHRHQTADETLGLRRVAAAERGAAGHRHIARARRRAGGVGRLQRARADDGVAAVGARAAQGQRASAEVGQRAGAADDAAVRDGIEAVEDQAGVVADVVGANRSRRAARADLQHTGADGRGAGISVRAGKNHRARAAFGQRTCTSVRGVLIRQHTGNR